MVRGIGLPVVVDTGAQGYILAWELNECSWFLSPCKSLKGRSIGGVCRSCLSLRIALSVREAVGFVPRNRRHGGGSGFDASESRMSDACGQGFDSPHLHLEGVIQTFGTYPVALVMPRLDSCPVRRGRCAEMRG